MIHSTALGTGKIGRLLFTLGWPAALNFLVVTIYNITDVIFVGHWLGTMEIAAVVTGGTINFLFASFGLAIGIGGASIISRALGEKDTTKAAYTFGNQLLLAGITNCIIVTGGLIFQNEILQLFGAYGDILPPAQSYYRVLLYGTPLLSIAMMGNCVIQAEGKATTAMYNSLIPAVLNILLNPVCIKGFDMGIAGAAWATVISFMVGLLLVMRFFASSKTEIRFQWQHLRYHPALIRQITSIGGSVLLNIVAINLFVVLLNKSLYKYQAEAGVVIYSIINRINMLFQIPLIGIDGGIRPLIGYNFGSQQPDRIRATIYTAAKAGLIICFALLAIVLTGGTYLVRLFTDDASVTGITQYSLRIVLSLFPLMVIEIITVAYFQSIGKPTIAFGLTILRNIILLIPLLYILSHFYGFNGILYTFPLVDLLTTICAIWLLRNELTIKLPKRIGASIR